MTRLTRDEQYTLMTYFTIFKSPLMFGGDLPSNDEFTLSLLSNGEVLKMHRQSTGVRQLFQQDGKLAMTSRNPESGEVYLALFNISDSEQPLTLSVDLQELGFDTDCLVTNLWTGEELERASESISVDLAAHECRLFKLSH